MPPSSIRILEVAAVVVAGGVLREQRLGPVQVGGAEPELDRALCQVERRRVWQSRHSRRRPSSASAEPPVGRPEGAVAASPATLGRKGSGTRRTTTRRPGGTSNDHRRPAQAPPPATGTACRRAARRPTARRRPARRSSRSSPGPPVNVSVAVGADQHQVLGRRTRGRRRLRSRGGGVAIGVEEVGDGVAVEAAGRTGRRRRSRRRGKRSRLSARPSPLTCWLAPRVIGSALPVPESGNQRPALVRIVVDLDAVDIEPGAALAEDEGHHVPGVGAQEIAAAEEPVAFPGVLEADLDAAVLDPDLEWAPSS